MVSERTLSVSLFLLFVLSLLLSFSFYSGVSLNYANEELESRSAVKAVSVGLYADSLCSVRLDSINWGEVEAGGSRNVTCYVRNEGKSAVCPVLSTTNWNPSSAVEFVSLKWNYDGKPIPPSKIVAVTFCLTVCNGTCGFENFSFDAILSM